MASGPCGSPCLVRVWWVHLHLCLSPGAETPEVLNGAWGAGGSQHVPADGPSPCLGLRCARCTPACPAFQLPEPCVYTAAASNTNHLPALMDRLPSEGPLRAVRCFRESFDIWVRSLALRPSPHPAAGGSRWRYTGRSFQDEMLAEAGGAGHRHQALLLRSPERSLEGEQRGCQSPPPPPTHTHTKKLAPATTSMLGEDAEATH